MLDLASGTGTLAIRLKQLLPQAEVIGVDCDPAILSLAMKKAEEAKVSVLFDRAMSSALPYPDEHFDRVVSSLFFHHLSWQEKEQTAKELFRVLKPGAEFHVADWGRASNMLMRGLFLFEQLFDGFENTQDNVSGKLITLFKHQGLSKSPRNKRSTPSSAHWRSTVPPGQADHSLKRKARQGRRYSPETVKAVLCSRPYKSTT